MMAASYRVIAAELVAGARPRTVLFIGQVKTVLFTVASQ